ncbi:hypothetical protein LWI28_019371 [Acer negundo]|uniref:Uncharacterized protein n=1 Tax=Acer negundo TaxID=4023 RepID=A0AAD5I6S6_ACENE|nr:hypothetical protein LWI28_019371 [Acer negundo]KAK4833249.1 hypothetical protein QYF36_001509 [Acer negundo]
MAVVYLNCHKPLFSQNPKLAFTCELQNRNFGSSLRLPSNSKRHRTLIVSELGSGSDPNAPQDDQVDSVGVKAALSVLTFYKREISPLLLKSCRYVPTCSEYSMEAYKKYGFGKGTILTAWRLCRCNPFGGSGFDPPRWFDEESPPET